MANHFAEIDGKPHRMRGRTGEPRAGGRRREEGRLAHADGAGDRRCRAPALRRVPGRIRRAGGEGAHEHADGGRPRGRQHHADQPRRPRHGGVGAAADERPGHDRRDRLDRLPGRPRRRRREHRRGEGHDDDLDVRPPRHPGGGVGTLPGARRGLPAGRERLLRGACSARSAWRRRRCRPTRRRAPPPPRARPRLHTRVATNCCRRCRRRARSSAACAATDTWQRTSTRSAPSPRATRAWTPRRSG